jgi:tetratricopeptide (TPR) repeat protein
VNHALGLLLARQQDFASALFHLERAATVDVDSSQYSYVYAIALNSADQPAEALKVLELAQRRWPGNRQLLTTLMTLNQELGNTPAALGYGRQLLELVPDDQALMQYLQQLQQL